MNVDLCLIVYGFVAALAAPLILGGFTRTQLGSSAAMIQFWTPSVVDFPDPVAYCLPSPNGGTVIVSSGAPSM